MLSVTWTDPRGKVWDLSGGTEGVLLDLGQEGLDWSPIEHTWARGDMVWSVGRVTRGVHNLKITLGYSPVVGWLTGDALYQLLDEWWGQANSPFETGVLTVTRPDGQTRSRRLRLADTPGTSYTYDPGLGMEPVTELWSLTGDGGWWDGPEQSYTATYYNGALSGDQTKFYGGDTGAGWPLYISGGMYAGDAFVQNSGQGPMWLTWLIKGTVRNPTFGVTDVGVLRFEGTISVDQTVEISTDPTDRYVIDVDTGESLYSQVSGVWAPVPVGDRVPLTIAMDSNGTGVRVIATGREQFARAF